MWTPGGFCVNAPDMFHESTPVPPIKLARRGVMQADVHDMFVRKSRTPDMIALQIRSQFAGLRATKARMVEMLEEYGPRVVKGAMRQMIKDTSEAVSRRLLQIPDGDWQETIFLSSVGPDDRATHRLVTRLRKEGDRLIFSNEGTDPQFFAANGTFSAWRSANICASACLLAYDQFYCAAGVADHMEFRPDARHPQRVHVPRRGDPGHSLDRQRLPGQPGGQQDAAVRAGGGQAGRERGRRRVRRPAGGSPSA